MRANGIDLDLVRACEERIVNCWPAVETLLVDGFVVRFANGYSGRANSASPMKIGASLSALAIDHIEALYRAAGLPPQIRLTPLAAPGFEACIAARGYVLKDASFGMIGDLAPSHASISATISVEPRPAPAWLEGVSRLQDAGKQDPAHLAAIVGRIRVPARFVTLIVDGDEVGYGMIAIDRGMAELGSIILAPQVRGRGHGRALVVALMQLARELGADRAFLQVDVMNARAIALYGSLGFTPVYRYET